MDGWMDGALVSMGVDVSMQECSTYGKAAEAQIRMGVGQPKPIAQIAASCGPSCVNVSNGRASSYATIRFISVGFPRSPLII